MKFYVSCTRYGGTCYLSYDGMNQDTINNLLNDLGATSVQYITEDAYNTAVQAL